jgi:hypothetical protein
MKRAILLAAAILVCAAATAQTSDGALLRRASFDSPAAAADSAGTAAGRLAAAVGRQLAGTCPFDPDQRTFFREAVRQAGFFPAVIFTVDRMTRGGRIGTAQHHHFSEDGLIHEGVEAYLPDKRKKP